MTRNQIVAASRRQEACHVCRALPGADCDCELGGVHIIRVHAAWKDGHIATADYASVFPGVFTRLTVVSPERGTP